MTRVLVTDIAKPSRPGHHRFKADNFHKIGFDPISAAWWLGGLTSSSFLFGLIK